MYNPWFDMPIKHDILTEASLKFSYEKPTAIFLVCLIFFKFKNLIFLNISVRLKIKIAVDVLNTET